MINKVNRRQVLQSAAALGLVSAIPGAAPGAAMAQSSNLRWGSSSLGSSGYVILEALANVSNQHTDLKSAVQATAGTTENFVLMGRNKLDIAHTTSLDWVAAKAGQKPYPGQIEANQLLGYVRWMNPPLVKADSDIKTIEDLRGRTYSSSKPGAGATTASRILFEVAGIAEDVKWVYGAWGEIYDNFGLGQIDCVHGIFPNGYPIGIITKAEARAPLRALEYPEEILQKANEMNAGLLSATLTPDTWPALDKPIRCPALAGILGAATSVSAEVGYAVTKAVLDNAEEVRKFGQALAGVNIETAIDNLLIGYSVNAGAAQYYKEQGVWREELTIAS